MKRALRKVCDQAGSQRTWDERLPYVALAYNCSRQEATKCSPYALVYAREPHFPSPAVKEAMGPLLLHLSTPALQEAAAQELQVRAEYLQRTLPTVANNLAISQHRDTLRYAQIKGGGYTPKLRRVEPGDFVYVRRGKAANTLSMQVKQLILRVLEVRPSGVVVLQGRCGCTVLNHARNTAPCHLPDLDPTIDPTLAMPPANLACEVCDFPDDEGVMLLCDVCNCGYHTYCLEPPLTAVPKGAWICPSCKAAGITAIPAKDKVLPKPQVVRKKNPKVLAGRRVCVGRVGVHGAVTQLWGTLGATEDTRVMAVQWDSGDCVRCSVDEASCLRPFPVGTLPLAQVAQLRACASHCSHPAHLCDCP